MSFGIPVRNGLAVGLSASTFLSSMRIGGRPAMSLDFIGTNSLDSRVTFTRATTATFVGSDGLIQSAAINAPRFDYSPTTLAPRGLLIEEARTNLFINSGSVGGTGWLNIGGTATANAATSPDGTETAYRFNAASGTSAFGYYQNFTYTAAAYTISAYLKAGTYSYATLDFSNLGTLAAAFNLANGTVIATSSGITATITSAGNGWYRCTATGTMTAVSSFPEIYFNGSSSAISRIFTAAGTETFFVWGAQLEAGAFATSYIPTTTAAVTRSADTVSMTGTNFTDWYNTTQGTFFVQYSVAVNGAFVFCAVNSATPTTEHMFLRYLATQHQGITVTGGVSVSAIYDGTAASVINNVKTAFAYKASAYGIRSNGGALSSAASNSASGALPSGINKLVIGANQTGTSGFVNGRIAKLSYYNISLPNAALQALTA